MMLKNVCNNLAKPNGIDTTGFVSKTQYNNNKSGLDLKEDWGCQRKSTWY